MTTQPAINPPETRTPCSLPNPCEDGDLCATHEEEQAHAEGDHSFCGPTCEVEFPTELLRNSILAWTPPGAAGMLDELLRRAAVQAADASRAAVLLDAAKALEDRFGDTPASIELRLMSTKATVAAKLVEDNPDLAGLLSATEETT